MDLGDGAVVITIFPQQNVLDEKKMTRASDTTLSGVPRKYKWAEFDNFIIPIKFMPDSDSSQVNEWWRAQTTLTFSFDLIDYSVKITNAGRPFTGTTKPYVDEWAGQINLESV